MLFSLTLALSLCHSQGGIYVFQLMDHYTAVVSLMFLAFFEVLAVCWIFGTFTFLHAHHFSHSLSLSLKGELIVFILVRLTFNKKVGVRDRKSHTRAKIGSENKSF